MKKRTAIICVSCLVFLLALGITLYPIIANQYNARHQSEIHTRYRQEVENTDTAAIAQVKENAIRYNEALVSADPFSGDAIEQASKGYADQLNLTGDEVMGYVRIPKIGVTLPIYHGTSDATLELGVGHLLGSSLPVGGESTHTILSGHSGMASQKMFSDLPELETGDVFYLEILGETLAYQVYAINTVLPYDTSLLAITPEADYCTLVTCTPFGVNTHRLLVRGTRIPYSEEEKAAEESRVRETAASTWERQYLRGVFIGLGCCAALAAITLCGWGLRKYLGKRGR